MFGFFKKGLKSNKPINPVDHSNNVGRQIEDHVNRAKSSTQGLDDRTKQMMERMNRLNDMNRKR